MERVYTNYTASGRQVVLNNVPSSFATITVENIRLIFNETQKNEKGESLDPLASTGCKENILSVTYNDIAKTVTIVLADIVPVITPTDKLTIKIDMGDGLENMGSAIIEIDTSLLALESTTAKEATLGISSDISVSKTIFGWLKSIRDFLVEIVTTNPYALQGNDPTATNTAILQAIPTIPTDYAKAGSGTNVTNTDLKNLLNGISTAMYKGVPVVTPQGSGTQANPYVLQPNQWNQFSNALSGEDIYFSKGTDIANITNCYMVRFELAANWSGTSVNFEGFSLDWNGGSVPTWTAGHIYEISIVDNIALWADITPSA